MIGATVRRFVDAIDRSCSWLGRHLALALATDWQDDTSRHQRAPERLPGPPGTGLWIETARRPGRLGDVDAVCARDGCYRYGDQVPLWHVHEAGRVSCHSGLDGDCTWDYCPQLRDGEPVNSGRDCPLIDPTDER